MPTTYEKLLEKQRTFFRSGATKDLDYRISKMKRLYAWVKKNEREISETLHKELRKSSFESYLTEIMGVVHELRGTIRNLRRWARPRSVRTPLTLFRSSSKYYYEPLGTVLVITAWNYPFTLGLMPVIGALAAGNCCIIKPSELAPHTSRLLAKMAKECFAEEYCAVVEGGVEETTRLLENRFDFIHYTGSSRVGKIIASAAATQLTPISLELGGKCPCFVDETADMAISAKRICFGKYVNSGQTCVALDYILVQRKVKDALVEALKKEILHFYGPDPQKSPDYCRIINERHFDRVCALLKGEKIAYGGNTDSSDLYIEPTILTDITWDSAVMREEIFGPILPVIAYDDLAETIAMMQTQEKPLAAYVFSKNKTAQDMVMHGFQFGSGAINTVGVQIMNSQLPFGGVGHSGMGSYHGKWGFETFSHKKSILNQALWPNFSTIFPPYQAKALRWLKKM